jgi:hypothetical protein
MTTKTIKFAGLAAGMVLAAVAWLGSPYWTHSSEQLVVTGVTVKQYDHKSKYIVFTSDGVFENTDSWYYLKFNSSDIQGQLMQGGTFNVSYYGWRVPFFSQYPNITDVTRIK